MFSDLGPEELQALFTVVSVLLPAALYGMGLMESRNAHRFFLAGLAVHALTIVQRAFAVGGVPLAEKHDNISFMAFCMALVYWYVARARNVRDLGLYALPLIALTVLSSSLFAPINTVSPFLRSPWFYLHSLFYFLSYGFFGVSACVGVVYVLSGDVDHEALQYRTALAGWTLFTISLVAGSVWFFMAYGLYWLWTSKELWTTLTWFFFGMYLHQRYIRGISGRTAAIVGILGYLVALFTYFGVGTIIPAPPVQF
jgi:ABC-type transport system involved in cytochrome c biogenesis permease subunit